MKFWINKEKKILWGVIIGVGIFLIILGIILCIFNSKPKNMEETKGVISGISSYKDRDGERHYSVYVEYEVNEKNYMSKLNRYSSKFYEGEEIKIYYNNDNPREIELKTFNLWFLMIPGIGIVCILIGGTGLFIKFDKIKKDKKPKKNEKKNKDIE